MSTIEGMDKDMLATLTDEEREAITVGELSPEEQDALKAVASGADDDEDDDADEDDGGEGEKGAAPVEGKAADEGAADDEGEADDDEAPAATGYVAKLPDDYANTVSALKQEAEDLARQFKDGDIDLDEFQRRQAEIAERRDELVVARAKAEIASEMTEQSAAQSWQNTIRDFMRETAKAGDIDYRKDAEKMADLDNFVKVLASKPEHEDKSGEWFLREAHKRVLALHGVAAKPAADKPATQSRKQDRSAIPANLSQVPGGDGPGDLAGEFADIESLDGIELERAIAKMTPAQRERFSMA